MDKIEYLKAEIEDEQDVRKILEMLGGDRDGFDIGKFVVAKSDGRVVGCVRAKVFSGGTLELSSLAVLPEYQNRGIGSELIRNYLRLEQSRPIFLLTSSDKENFYKKFGFKLADPDQLPDDFKPEYLRIIGLPFAKNIKVIAMKIE